TNTGNIPLKLYSIYAPPNHPFGTVHVTKADAIS
ncbi:cupin domain-containing protein, partial [Bacillus paranthracis]|nr:cupin domain-containing protein [Bacillus paranthracis]